MTDEERDEQELEALDTNSLAQAEATGELLQGALPDWAKEMVYQYDLDMATCCDNCDKRLQEDSTVWRDTEQHNIYYCSAECVLAVEQWCAEALVAIGWMLT